MPGMLWSMWLWSIFGLRGLGEGDGAAGEGPGGGVRGRDIGIYDGDDGRQMQVLGDVSMADLDEIWWVREMVIELVEVRCMKVVGLDRPGGGS